jgi:hypothetical protein
MRWPIARAACTTWLRSAERLRSPGARHELIVPCCTAIDVGRELHPSGGALR